MKKNKIIMLTVFTFSAIVIVSGFTKKTYSEEKLIKTNKETQNQRVNMFVTHGHCSTPFRGVVKDLKLNYAERTNAENPLEGMKLSFKIDPNTFIVCAGEALTEKIKKPGLFISEANDMIVFRTTDVYTMGIDWYQINGEISIKGEERSVKFFATGIRNPKDSKASSMVLEGQFNLKDWGIDYDKIVDERSNSVPTKWVHLNMRFKIS